jgi:hypothetical protein
MSLSLTVYLFASLVPFPRVVVTVPVATCMRLRSRFSGVSREDPDQIVNKLSVLAVTVVGYERPSALHELSVLLWEQLGFLGRRCAGLRSSIPFFAEGYLADKSVTISENEHHGGDSAIHQTLVAALCRPRRRL